LEVEFDALHISLFPHVLRLVHLAERLPHLRQLTLNPWGVFMKDVAMFARQYPSIGKYAKKLRMVESEPEGVIPLICFL